MEDLSASSSDGFMFEYALSEVLTIDPFRSDLQTSVVPLMVRRDLADDGKAEGTAFCVAHLTSGEAVFVTARHVVECLDGPDGIDAFLVLPRDTKSDEARHDLQPVHVQRVALSDRFSDVALLVVNISDGPTAGLGLRPFAISLGEPAVGQDCVGLGYPQEQGQYVYNLCAASGVVEEVHPDQRDSALSTFPSFRTTGKYLHGMSGLAS
jgi:hypothetical protein